MELDEGLTMCKVGPIKLLQLAQYHAEVKYEISPIIPKKDVLELLNFEGLIICGVLEVSLTYGKKTVVGAAVGLLNLSFSSNSTIRTAN